MTSTPSLSRLLVLAAVVACVARPAAAGTIVFSTDFESGLPAAMSAPGTVIEPVQGYAGLGSGGYVFGGSFLRYTAVALTDTQLTLAGLPPHDTIDVSMMLAVIDSWDGTELFQILVDGQLLFSHWFQLATGDTSSYAAPPGALLSSSANLGFSNGTWYWRDRAYDLSADPVLSGIPHTADTVTITWRLSAVSGPAAAQWQGGADESWAIENVVVEVSGSPTAAPEPAAATTWSRLKAMHRD